MSLRFLTAGESHGPGLTIVVDGVPAGVPVSEEEVAVDLRRRQGGYGRGGRQLIEQDYAVISAGLTNGLTTGAPIAMAVENKDYQNWIGKPIPVQTIPRPGHADLAGSLKFQQENMWIIAERSSARETAARVAAGGIAKALLKQLGVRIGGHVLAIGGIHASVSPMPYEELFALAEASPVRCADPEATQQMIARIDRAKTERQSVGGVVEIVAWGVAPGLGSDVHWDRKLDGRLAQAVMSIHAIKAVEVGDGFVSCEKSGTEVQDFIRWGDDRPIRLSNHAGGTEGGITNGEPVVVHAGMKPIATTVTPQPSVDMKTHEETVMQYVRSDICAVPAAAVVAEAMVALVLADAYLEKFGGDNVSETRSNLLSFLKAIHWEPLV
ncbi:MAG: chorismate synthase [Chloroflexi bacterium]|nr:chorismate synthase [Chloroflexota bacterium]